MIGQTLRNYVIEEQLGKGGMGIVYKARDTKLNRFVALKVIPPELTGDPERRRRFIQEARAASAVNHPAIAQIYEIDDTGDITFIVMEYVDGFTLRELIARKELDIATAVEVGMQVADALARAHEAGIVHRDIKSDNIMLTRDGHPKILDFGLAKLLDSGPGSSNPDVSRMETVQRTQAGVIMGTVAYMSPEQARGLPADKRSDVFSFGIVLYEMSTGQLPFKGASMLDTLHSLAFDQPQQITVLRADLPWSLQKVVDRCLQKKPEDRYQDLRQTVTDLKVVKREIDTGVSGGMPVMEKLQWWVKGVSTKGIIWAAVGGAVLGALGIGMLFSGDSRQGPMSVIAPLMMLVGIGSLMYRRFRNRGHKEMTRFVKKASTLKEVQLVTFSRGQFTVIADNPSPKTYVKLNALLTTANERLFRGEPMTMVVRQDVPAEEHKTILSSPGVQYVRDDSKKSRLLRAR